MDKKVNILAFAAHPDDAELSCSGTLIKQQKLGQTTGIIDLTKGELGTRGTIETRKAEAESAAEILKLSVRENLDLGDGFFQNELKEKLEIIRMIRKYQPDIMLGNAVYDRHPDHGRAGQLLKEASFLSGLRKIETKENGVIQQAWRPRIYLQYIQDRFIQPSLTVDISEEYATKVEGILAYKTQFYDPESKEPETYISSSHFLDIIKARAIEIGKSSGFKYAEGFVLEYTPGVKDLSYIY